MTVVAIRRVWNQRTHVPAIWAKIIPHERSLNLLRLVVKAISWFPKSEERLLFAKRHDLDEPSFLMIARAAARQHLASVVKQEYGVAVLFQIVQALGAPRCFPSRLDCRQ